MSSKNAKYRYRMTLQDYAVQRDEYRQELQVWANAATFWGSIELAYKGEEQIGGTRESDVPMVASLSQVWVFTRFMRSLVFSPRFRILVAAPQQRVLQITAVYEWGRQTEYKILCLEVQP